MTLLPGAGWKGYLQTDASKSVGVFPKNYVEGTVHPRHALHSQQPRARLANPATCSRCPLLRLVR